MLITTNHREKIRDLTEVEESRFTAQTRSEIEIYKWDRDSRELTAPQSAWLYPVTSVLLTDSGIRVKVECTFVCAWSIIDLIDIMMDL